MKHFMLMTILASFFSLSAFADQTGQGSTDCPMMSESTSRSNPKANLPVASSDVVKESATQSAQ